VELLILDLPNCTLDPLLDVCGSPLALSGYELGSSVPKANVVTIVHVLWGCSGNMQCTYVAYLFLSMRALQYWPDGSFVVFFCMGVVPFTQFFDQIIFQIHVQRNFPRKSDFSLSQSSHTKSSLSYHVTRVAKW
jgi:hypothetical protein